MSENHQIEPSDKHVPHGTISPKSIVAADALLKVLSATAEHQLGRRLLHGTGRREPSLRPFAFDRSDNTDALT